MLGSPQSVYRLHQFEEELGILLPSDYFEYMLTRNGGELMPDHFKFEHPIYGETIGVMGVLFGYLENRGDPLDIRLHLEILRNRIPEKHLPIGGTANGDVLLLDVTNNGNGSVFLWDLENEDPTDSTHNMYLVSSSFGEFIKALFNNPYF